MRKPATIKKITTKLIALIPWKLRIVFSRIPFFNSQLRRLLNWMFLSEQQQAFEITVGLLKGFALEMHLQQDKSFWLAIHEPHLQLVLQKIIRPGWIVYDIGAYIGYYTLLFSVLSQPGGQVLAFEPQPDNFQKLGNNIARNHLNNVRAFKMAVSSKTGWAYFQGNTAPAQGRLIPSSPPVEMWNSTLPRFKVRVTTLDTIVFREGWPAPTLVKIDVEGGEDRVLMGMTGVLKESRPVIICEVHAPDLGKRVWSDLAVNEYLIFALGREIKRITSIERWRAEYLIAVPRDKIEVLKKIGVRA